MYSCNQSNTYWGINILMHWFHFGERLDILNVVHVTELSSQYIDIIIKPFKCSLCDRVFVSPYGEETVSMQNRFILENYYTHRV